MSLFRYEEHDDRGISNVELGWLVYFWIVIGLMLILLLGPAVF